MSAPVVQTLQVKRLRAAAGEAVSTYVGVGVRPVVPLPLVHGPHYEIHPCGAGVFRPLLVPLRVDIRTPKGPLPCRLIVLRFSLLAVGARAWLLRTIAAVLVPRRSRKAESFVSGTMPSKVARS